MRDCWSWPASQSRRARSYCIYPRHPLRRSHRKAQAIIKVVSTMHIVTLISTSRPISSWLHVGLCSISSSPSLDAPGKRSYSSACDAVSSLSGRRGRLWPSSRRSCSAARSRAALIRRHPCRRRYLCVSEVLLLAHWCRYIWSEGSDCCEHMTMT
jgi:hypothetical protein